jgi:hypothetical protein
MTREPGKARFPRFVETVGGDLTDPAGLEPVLTGVDRLYLFPVARTARQVVDRARRAAIRRVVVLSSAAVTSGADTTGRPVRLAAVSPEEARDHYRRQGGFAAQYADFLLGFTDYQGSRREPTSAWYPDVQGNGPRPTAQGVTGRPARTFAQWAHDHADDLRP